MDRAADVGLLTSLGGGRYQIHPALPSYLARQWRLAAPLSFDREHTAATRGLLFAFAAICDKLDQQIERGNSAPAVAAIEAHRHTLGTLLGYAIDHQLWARAQAIAQPLVQYWDLCGLQEEARGWTRRIEPALGNADDAVPDLAAPAGRLWLLLAGSQANRQIIARQLDDAERTYQAILRALQRQPRPASASVSISGISQPPTTDSGLPPAVRCRLLARKPRCDSAKWPCLRHGLVPLRYLPSTPRQGGG